MNNKNKFRLHYAAQHMQKNRRLNSNVSVEHSRYNNASYNNQKVQGLTEPESKVADKTAILSQTKENSSPESGQTQKPIATHKRHS